MFFPADFMTAITVYTTRGDNKFSLNSATINMNLLESCSNYTSYDSEINYSHCQGSTIGRISFVQMHAFVTEEEKS